MLDMAPFLQENSRLGTKIILTSFRSDLQQSLDDNNIDDDGDNLMLFFSVHFQGAK